MQSNPFYHLFNPNVTHVRLCTKFAAFLTASNEKLGGRLSTMEPKEVVAAMSGEVLVSIL